MEAIKGVKATQKRRLLIAQQAIDVYRCLYRIESRVNHLDPVKKTRVRQRFAVPTWDRFERWARKTIQGGVLHKGTREALLPWNITPAEIRRRFEAMPRP